MDTQQEQPQLVTMGPAAVTKIKELLKEEDINLPIQVKGKFVTTIETNKGYKQEDILKTIYQLTKIKSKIENKKIIKVINVQDKIINIITD